MVILGLTGSIGMGKTVTATLFAREGVPVFDADACVHRLLGPGGAAVAAVAAAFAGVVVETPLGLAVDRGALAARVFGDAAAIARLEAVVHPLVQGARGAFLKAAARRRAPLVVLDVPLLFETGGDRCCDRVAVVWAPPWVQARRVLARPGMTPARFAAIRARQTPDREKLRRADFVIPTALGRALALRHVRAIVAGLAGTRGRSWPPRVQRCWPPLLPPSLLPSALTVR